MSVDQAYYTSCENGLSGTKGFQVNAVSVGLDPGTLALLQRNAVYIPPISSPTRPTDDELATFPIALAFRTLSDGSAVLSQSKYIGKDYSGRYGNYFTHFIASKDTESFMEMINPIQGWKASFWRDRASPTTQIPPLNSLQTDPQMSPSVIRQRIKERYDLSRFEAFVASVQGALETKKRIIVADTDESVATLVAGVALVLPSSLLGQLTFNTYSKTPGNEDVIICGTTTDSDFAFSPMEIEHQFYVFDFVEHRFSNTPPPGKFASTVASRYHQGTAETLSGFKTFVDRLNIEISPRDLDLLTDVYEFSCEGRVDDFRGPATIEFILENKLFYEPELFSAVLVGVQEISSESCQADQIANAIFATVMASDASAEIKNDVGAFYVDWVVDRVLPQRSTAALQEASRLLGKYELVSSHWQRALSRFSTAFEQSDDLSRLTAMIDFAGVVGVRSALRDTILQVLDRVVIARIDTPEAQEFAERLMGDPEFPEITELVGDQLLSMGAADAGRATVVTMLKREVTREKLSDHAKHTNKASLMMLIGAAEVSQAQHKLEATLRILKSVESSPASDEAGGNCDLLFQYGWPGPIPPTDALALVRQNSAMVLRSSVFANRAVDGLLHSPNIVSLDPGEAILNLIKELQTTPGGVVAIQPVDKLLTVVKRFHAAKSLPERLSRVAEVLRLLSPDNTRARVSAMFTAISSFLSVGGNNEVKLRYIERLASVDDRALLSALAGVLSRVDSRHRVSVSSWTQLFRFLWTRSQTANKPELPDKILEEDFAAAFSKLSGAQKDAIEQHFLTSDSWKDPWLQWKQRNGRGSLFKKLFGKRR